MALTSPGRAPIHALLFPSSTFSKCLPCTAPAAQTCPSSQRPQAQLVPAAHQQHHQSHLLPQNLDRGWSSTSGSRASSQGVPGFGRAHPSARGRPSPAGKVLAARLWLRAGCTQALSPGCTSVVGVTALGLSQACPLPRQGCLARAAHVCVGLCVGLCVWVWVCVCAPAKVLLAVRITDL